MRFLHEEPRIAAIAEAMTEDLAQQRGHARHAAHILLDTFLEAYDHRDASKE